MKRVLLILIPWMATIAAASQSLKPISVKYTYHGPTTGDALKTGSECYVPIRMAEGWGWKFQVRDGQADIFAEGRKIRVPIRRGSSATFPLGQALDQLGGKLSWKSDNEAEVRGQVRRVSVEDGRFSIDSTLAMSCVSTVLEDPTRMVIDFVGAELNITSLPKFPDGVRLGQYRDGTVRLVVESTTQISLSKLPGRSFNIDVAALLKKPENPKITITPLEPEKPEEPGAGNEPQDEATKPRVSPSNGPSDSLVEIKLTSEGASDTVLDLQLTPKPIVTPTVEYESPTSLIVTFPGSHKIQVAADTIESNFVTAISTIDSAESGQIRIELRQALGYVMSATTSGVSIRLVKPRVSDGRLTGKTIVVDAGHGGTDTGAKAGEIFEKDLTLKMAKLVARELSSEGAAVIMTRTDDVKVPLLERSAIATRSNADLFVSIHINSNTLSNSRSGCITFFHNQEPISMALAESIQTELAKIGGIPGIGIWSDTRIYKSGFSVLRNATMPAVLLELGFINHGSDRAKLTQDGHQIRVAQAVVKGLKVFLGDGK